MNYGCSVVLKLLHLVVLELGRSELIGRDGRISGFKARRWPRWSGSRDCGQVGTNLVAPFAEDAQQDSAHKEHDAQGSDLERQIFSVYF